MLRPNRPIAFLAPHDGATVLWVSSPSGHLMLLAGHWRYASAAKTFAVRCGYKLIATDLGMAIVEQQMNERAVRSQPTVH